LSKKNQWTKLSIPVFGLLKSNCSNGPNNTSQYSNSFSVEIQWYQWTKGPNLSWVPIVCLLKFICTNGPNDQILLSIQQFFS
jgi:hypothetical protein